MRHKSAVLALIATLVIAVVSYWIYANTLGLSPDRAKVGSAVPPPETRESTVAELPSQRTLVETALDPAWSILDITSEDGRPIAGARIDYVTASPYQVEQAPLAVSDATGRAIIKKEETISCVVAARPLQPRTLQVSPGKHYRVVLVAGMRQVFDCRDTTGKALAGVTVAVSKGGACTVFDNNPIQEHPAPPKAPSNNPATALYQGKSASDGRVLFDELTPGEYRVFIRPPEGYVVDYPHVQHALYCPSPPVSVQCIELLGAVLSYADDEVVTWEDVETVGLGRPDSRMGPAFVPVKKKWNARFPKQVVIVGVPLGDSIPTRTATVRPFLRRRGWVSATTVQLLPLHDLRPRVEVLPAPTTSDETCGLVSYSIKGPDGETLPISPDELLVLTSQDVRGRGLTCNRTNDQGALIVPAGEWYAVPMSNTLSWAFEPCQFKVAAGKTQTVGIIAKHKLHRVTVSEKGAAASAQQGRIPFLLWSAECTTGGIVRRGGGQSFYGGDGEHLWLTDGLWRIVFYRDGCDPCYIQWDAAASGIQPISVEFQLAVK